LGRNTGMSKLKYLIVDDDKNTTTILTKMLENEHNEVMVATSGKKGLQLFKYFKPDIIMSDINMPEMNGLEMVEHIRSIDPDVKIAIFTSFDNKDYLLKAIQIGVDQFFSKPFEKVLLQQIIDRLSKEILEKRNVQAALDRHQNILMAINTMSERFLQQSDWQETLIEQMRILKVSAEASSLFIYKNEEDDNPKWARKHLDLNDNSDAVAPDILPYKAMNLLEWSETFKRGESICGLIDDFDAAKQALFYEYRVNSLLMLPIICNNRWWGFLGIGNNERRLFDEIDKKTLKTVAQLLGSALDNLYNINSLKLRSAIFRHTVDGVMVTNSENKIIHINDAFTNITGYTLDDVEGKNPKILSSGLQDKTFYRKLWTDIEHHGYWQGEIKNRRKNGEMYIGWLSINLIKDQSGKVENHVAVFSDVTSRRSNDAKYMHMATHDALTGLSNRLILNDRLEHAILHATRAKSNVTVLFCDLDNFKPINDSYGHGVGDEVLKLCAQHFKSVLRSEDSISRYGGDEFVIVLEDINDKSILTELMQKVMSITERTVTIEGHKINIQMSVGMSTFPHDGDTGELLIKNADKAMYRAKKAGKNRLASYSEDLMLIEPDAKISIANTN
jgi:diguanylate cyclase (GGDEF)-like protein/PAS domain S-box-containing protein